MTLRFRKEALSDLEEIGDYIATDNPLRAESFVGELRAHGTHCQAMCALLPTATI